MPVQYDIVIPAYNAHKNLPLLLQQLEHLPHPPETVVIVDDGSQPAYSFTESDRFKIHLIRLQKNSGKGKALKAGIELFLNAGRAPYILFMDADGQHPVSSISDFLKAMQGEQFDVLIGNRVQRIGNMPALRIFSNTISSLIVSWVTGQRIADSQCGFRLLKREVVERIDLQEEGFQIETEFIIKAVRNGFKIGFVPIPTIYNGHKSYIRHINDTLRFVQIVVKELLSR